MVTKMIQTFIQKKTKMNLNLSFTQFSETRLPQARSGLLPQAIEIKQKIIWILHWKKLEKWNPSRGPGKVQRTSFSLPKFGLGPLGHPKRRQSASRNPPGRLLTEFGTDFMMFWSLWHQLFFDFLHFFEQFLRCSIQKNNWKNPEYIQKSNKTSIQSQMKMITRTDLNKTIRLLH